MILQAERRSFSKIFQQVPSENNTVFANNIQKTVATDLVSGTKWSFTDMGGTFFDAALAGGNLLGSDFGNEVIFDPLGNTTPITVDTGLFWQPGLAHTFSADGGVALSVTSIGNLANSSWLLTQGNKRKQQAPTLPKIIKLTRNRAMVGDVTNLVVRGTDFGQSPSLVFGDPARPNPALTTDNFQYDPTTGVITVDVHVAPGTVGGKVPILVKNGNRTSAADSKVFFFVQIPKSVSPTAFAGEFDNIGPTGMGPLHTPQLGIDDYVFDPAHAKQSDSPVCGVYRNYVFQLMDQDDTPQPIRAKVSITENISPGTPRTVSTNNGGQFFDTHGLAHTASCLQPGELLDVTQTFVVQAFGGSFELTTTFKIKAGNDNGTLFESTVMVHQ